MAAAAVVEELLECTICNEVAPPPIHTCSSNGHITCGVCIDKVKKCGVCRCSELKVCELAERLSREKDSKSRCPNYGDGCRIVMASADLKDHTEKCYFRNALCNEASITVCNNVSIPLKDFPQHLKDKHGALQYNGLSSITSFFPIAYNGPRNFAFPLSITEQDGQTFVLRYHLINDIFFAWMSVLSDPKEAKKYTYELTLAKTLRGNKKIKCSWTMPVLAYHDVPEFTPPGSTQPDSRFMMILSTSFIQFCKTEVRDEQVNYVFNISQRIF